MTGPSDALDQPFPHESIPSSLDTILDLGSWLSPSKYLDKGIEFVFGTNPAQMLSDYVVGDWKSLSTASSALDQLAEYFEAYGNEVGVSNDLMQFHWTGHAAERADAYFSSLADTVNDFAPELRGLSSRYQDIAVALVEFAKLVSDAVDWMEDTLIGIGVKLIADALLAETVVGSIAVSAWVISDAGRVVHRLHELIEAYDKLTLVVKGLVAGGAGAIGAVGGIPELALPPSYDAPGATR